MSDPKAKKHMIMRWDEDQPDVIRVYTNDRGWHLFFRNYLPERKHKKPRFFRDKIDGKRDFYAVFKLPAFIARRGLRRLTTTVTNSPERLLKLRLSMLYARKFNKNYKPKKQNPPGAEELLTQIEQSLAKNQEDP